MAAPKRIKPKVWILPLSSLYTSGGLFAAARWLKEGGDFRSCPFESPEQAETIAIRLIQAKFGLSPEQVKEHIGRILTILRTEIDLESEIEEQKKINLDSYVPPLYLLQQWERDAKKNQLTRERTKEFITLQTRGWLARLYQLYRPASRQELFKINQQKGQEIAQLFGGPLTTIKKNLPDLRKEALSLITKSFPELSAEQKRSVLDLVYKDFELGFIEAKSVSDFKASLELSVSNAYQEAVKKGLPADYRTSFEKALQTTYPSKEKLETAATKTEEINKARNVIERTLRTVIPALLPEGAALRVTPKEAELEETPKEEAIPVSAELPFLEWQFPEIEISLPERLLVLTGKVTPEALIELRNVIGDVASTVLKKQVLPEKYPAEISEERLASEGILQRKPTPPVQKAVLKPFQRIIENIRSLITRREVVKEKPIVELPKEAEEVLSTAIAEKLQLAKEKLSVKSVGNIVTIFLSALSRPKVKTSLPQRIWALAQKAILFPVVKPLQLLINLSPDNFQRANPEIFYLFKYGLTPEEIDQKIVQLRQINRQHPQLPLWQNLKDRLIVFEENHPRFSFIFRRYFQSSHLKYQSLGQTVGVVRPRVSRFWRFITRGRFKNFADIKSAFWRFFKKTRFGKWLGAFASKILVKLGLGAVSLGIIPVIAAGWATFKKIGKLALAAIAAIILWAAHYGPLALGGALAGLLAGIPLGIKAGASVAGALAASGVGLIIAIPAGIITGFVVMVGTTLIGAGIGVAIQMLIDKISVGLSNVSIPGILTSWLNKATAAVPNIATPAVGGTVATAFWGVYLISQITSSAFIGEEAISSPYIEVTKTVTFSGTIGDPINYKIQVKAVDKTLTNVTITDQATAICKNTPPPLAPHNWDGNITIDSGSTWEQTYNVNTNSQFNDCLISNTARVTAIIDGQTQSSFTVGRVSIGNPPVVIPQGLPVHDNPQRGEGYTYNQQIIEERNVRIHKGIDVHGPSGCLVYSTFPSESTVIDVGYGARNGYYIILGSGAYQTFMGHLAQRPRFDINEKIGSLAPVGVQGNTGYSSAEHTHYMIWENGVVVDPRNFGVPSPPW